MSAKIGCAQPGCWAFVIVFALFLGWAMTPNKPKDSPSTTTGQNGSWITANMVAECENAVSARLKSPSTAEFQHGISSESMVKEAGAGKTVVREYVDSQNGFGATVRSNVACYMNGYSTTATVDSVQIY